MTKNATLPRLFLLIALTYGALHTKAQSWSLAGNADTTGVYKLGTVNALPLRLFTNDVERMHIDSAGNVGIGVPNATTPFMKAKLVVNAAAGSSPLRVMVNNKTKLLLSPGGGLSIGGYTPAPSNGLYVLGRTGIGTSTPKTKLDIAGGNGNVDSAEGDLRVGNDSFRLKIGVATKGPDAGDARIRAAGGTARLMLGAADALVINSSGKIGMGAPAPAARLDVRSNDGSFAVANFANAAITGDRSALVTMQNGNDAPVPWRYGVGGTGNELGLTEGQFYLERTGGGVRFLVSNTGNVGIGTLNPQYKLSVAGTIQAKEVRVETGWADFVFNKGYRLRPLPEVAGYIEKNGHLPDVPPAAEIREKGLELAAMNTIMMQKIEELTLYVIEQQKEISRLAGQVSELQKKGRNK